MGDPSGIGAQVIAKALAKSSIRQLAHFKIIGDYSIFKHYSACSWQNIDFVDLRCLSLNQWKRGEPNKHSATASLNYLYKAVDLIKNHDITALVTAPVGKEAISDIDPSFQGHTEFLAKAFNVKNVEMMFVAETMRTVVITRHIPLKKVPPSLGKQRIWETIDLTNQSLKHYFKIKNPHIAVCGLNPHAGEGGQIGSEEIQHIIPAIKKAKNQKINIAGPFPADTLFKRDTSRRFDAIIAMYHDQGLIPIKTLFFNSVVNLTLGLPFVRTSPAHGTAFDIAKKTTANPSSMCEAIKLAAQLS